MPGIIVWSCSTVFRYTSLKEEDTDNEINGAFAHVKMYGKNTDGKTEAK